MDSKEKFYLWTLTMFLGFIFAVFLTSLFCGGCAQYKGAKVVEGTDLAVGITIPVENAPLKFEALNYLSGFRLGIDQNARMELTYTVAETNNYFGIITTIQHKSIDAVVEPCEAGESPEGNTEDDCVGSPPPTEKNE